MNPLDIMAYALLAVTVLVLSYILIERTPDKES